MVGTAKCEPFHMGGVILGGNCATLLRFRQIMKKKKPHNRSSRTVPPTTPPTIGPTGVVEDDELDDELGDGLEEDEVPLRGDPFKSGFDTALISLTTVELKVPLK